ncbi:MAG: hypothetical protein HGB11_03660 [Chlorobiales bacterium]|nr:hypothetical protein [Chlorobiales bacterium]
MSDRVALSEAVHSSVETKRTRSVDYLVICFFILLLSGPFLKLAYPSGASESLIGRASVKEKIIPSVSGPLTDFKKSCIPISIEQLKRDADILVHKRIVIQGKTLQVFKQDKGMIMRVMATGNQTNGQVIVLADAQQSIGDGDMVTVWGTVTGNNTRQSESVWTIADPSVKAAYIEK